MSLLDDVPFGMREDYGVPTGAVPRRPYTAADALRDHEARIERFVAALADTATLPPHRVVQGLEHLVNPPRFDGPFAKPAQQAVDAYLLMERKAKAWDRLRRASAADPAAQLDGAHFESWLDAIWEETH